MLHILKHKQEYFQTDPAKTIVVLCNNRVDGSAYEEQGDADVITLQDFDVEVHLRPEIVLIFEDVQFLTEKITDCINIYAHHFNLAAVFVVVQGILGSDDLFRLLSLTHRLILFYSSSVCTRLSQYLNSHFFQDQDLKAYIRAIRHYSESRKNILLLELNQIQGKNKTRFLAISGLGNIACGEKMTPPPVYYPHLSEKKNYRDKFGDNEADVDVDDEDGEDEFPDDTYVLVPAKNVRKHRKIGSGGVVNSEDERAQIWNNMVKEIEIDIESSLPAKKWQVAKNIMRSILKSKLFSVSTDGKVLMIKGKPKSSLPFLDYIIAAVRQSGPNEIGDPLNVQITKLLLSRNTPTIFFKNKSLLRDAAGGLRKLLKKNKKD